MPVNRERYLANGVRQSWIVDPRNSTLKLGSTTTAPGAKATKAI